MQLEVRLGTISLPEEVVGLDARQAAAKGQQQAPGKVARRRQLSSQHLGAGKALFGGLLEHHVKAAGDSFVLPKLLLCVARSCATAS